MPSPEPKAHAAPPWQESQGTANQPLTTERAPKPAAHSEMGGAFSYECDDACLLPGAPVPAGKYAVVSPVPTSPLSM